MSLSTSNSIDISVVIAAYDAADYVGHAIRACLKQESVELEVIVVDDCSPISLETCVEDAAAGDARVRYIRLAQNQGPAGARNAALDVARGEYIAVLDADDDMMPGRLEKLLRLARDNNVDLVVDNLIEVFSEGDKRLESLFLEFEAGLNPFWIDLEAYMGSGFTPEFKRPLGYLKPLFRRTFVDTQPFRYDTSLMNSEDHYLVAEMLAHGARMLMTPDAGYYYVRHEASLSYRLTAAQANAIVAAEKAFFNRHTDSLSAAQKRISLLRQRALRKTAAFEAIIEALKAKAVGRALGLILSNPVTAPEHIGRLFSIGLRKLT